MTKIIIHPKDQVYVKIESEEYIRKELSDFFTFTVPNHKFYAQTRKFKWRGQIKLFNMVKNELYRGLIPYLEQFAKDRGYTVSFSDSKLDQTNDISVFEVKQFAKSLKLCSGGKSIEPHDHQILAVTHALRNKRLLVLSPTASGKSLIMYLLVRSLLPTLKEKILIIVPTVNLVNQLYTDFIDYSTENHWDVEKFCHRIYAGQEKLPQNKWVYISTWQSLQTLSPDYFQGFGAVIGDEAHTCTANSLKRILTHSTGTKYRIGLSGTLDGTKVHQLMLEGLFGIIYKPITTREMIDQGKASDIEIKCVVLRHKYHSRMEYKDEIEYLIGNEKRNRFIRNLAMSLENNTLILYQFVEKHGQVLKKLLDDCNDGSKKVYFISGKVDVEIRENIRQILETENNAIIVASYGTWAAGANMKNLHNVIFASPSKGRIRILQSIGRALRLHPSKIVAKLFDLSDDMRYHKDGDYGPANYTLDHFVSHRLRYYREEQFNFKIYKVQL